MPVQPEPTPNPNAMKFTVGRPVGGPATHTAGSDTGDDALDEVLALPGVTSVFLTADFVTVSKTPDGDWTVLVPAIVERLTERFD